MNYKNVLTKEINWLIYLLLNQVQGTITADIKTMKGDNEFVAEIWKGVLLRAGNYTYDAPEFKGIVADTSNNRTLVGFSRFSFLILIWF